VLDIFGRHPWPGNIRELRSAIKEAALRTTGRFVLPEFLPPGLTGSAPVPAAPVSETPPAGLDLVGTIEELLRTGQKDIYARIVAGVERELLTSVLRHTRGHQGQACEHLGIDRKTLRNKLRELGITLDKVVSDRVDSPEAD
jgi:DNA-binding NtrC family response regulator